MVPEGNVNEEEERVKRITEKEKREQKEAVFLSLFGW